MQLFAILPTYTLLAPNTFLSVASHILFPQILTMNILRCINLIRFSRDYYTTEQLQSCI